MRTFYYYLLAAVVLVVDFFTKKWVATQMNLGDKINVIGDFFLITSHRNKGAAFGILQDQRTFFIIITTVILIGLVWYMQAMRKNGNRILLAGLALVMGGAIGNFIDRVRFGEVVDFFQFNFGSYTFPIFNVADSGIVVGVGLILLDTLLGARDEKKAMKQAEAESKEQGENE